MIFAFLLSVFYIEVGEVSYCLAKQKSSCPGNRNWYPSDETKILSNPFVWKADILVVDSPKYPIDIQSKIGTVIIQGKDGTQKITASIPAWTTYLQLKDINFTAKMKSVFALTTVLNGSVSLGDFVLKTSDLNVAEALNFIKSNISVHLFWTATHAISGKLKAVANLYGIDSDRVLAVANNKVMVHAANNSNWLSIKSATPALVDLFVSQTSGKLDVQRYGSPDLNKMFKIYFDANGGIINFIDQTWKRIVQGFNLDTLLTGGTLMQLNYKQPTEIHIAGREIPLSITNLANSPLKVVVDKIYAGIQGELKFGTAEDTIELIKSLGKSPVEFAIGKLTAFGENKLAIPDNLGISMDEKFFEGILGAFQQFFKTITANIDGNVLKILNLATGGLLSSVISTENGNIKVGRIDVTDKFKLPMIGSAKFNLNTDINELSNFQNVKKLISNPITVFCSAEEFECNKFDINMLPQNSLLKMPKVEFKCFKNAQKQQCINVSLPRLPDFLGEKYCLAKSSSECPEDSIKITPDKAGDIINHVHSLTKKVLVGLGQEDASSVLDLIPFAGKDFTLSGKNGVRPNISVSLSGKFGDIFGGSATFDGVNLNADGQSASALSLFAPILNFKDTSLAHALDRTALNFQNNIVNMDKMSFDQFLGATFGTLNLAINDIVEAVKVTDDEFALKGQQVLENIKSEVIKSEFNAEIQIPSTGLTLSFGGSGTKGIGLNIKQTASIGNINFDYSGGIHYDWGKGVNIKADGNIKLNNLPNGINISISGKGNVDIDPATGVTSIDLDGTTEIYGNGKRIKIHGSANVDVNIKNLTVINAGGQIDGRISVLDPNDQEKEINIVDFNVEADCKPQMKKANVKGTVKLLPGSQINIGEISFNKDLPMKFRRALEDGDKQVLELHYKFKEGGFPTINAEKINNIPDEIRLVYDATEEENADLMVNEWKDTPQTIVFSHFDMDTCKAWAKKVTYHSVTPGVKSATFTTICDEDQDPDAYSGDENANPRIALMVSLDKVEFEDPHKHKTTDDELAALEAAKRRKRALAIGLSVFFVLVVLGVAAGLAVFFIKKRRANNDDKKAPEVIMV